jgi:oligopeptide/dipeptide ABC transporter ATP-binding protein
MSEKTAEAKATEAVPGAPTSEGVPSGAQDEALLKVEDVSKSFPIKRSFFEAVRHKPKRSVSAVANVSFDLRAGETLGLVGESGCGKSTLARTVINLYKPTGGKVTFEGVDTSELTKSEARDRCRDIQMIFQDPYSSLNPRMTVRTALREELLQHHMCSRSEVNGRIDELLRTVGLSPTMADRLPSAFSGGQRQRIGIARALAVRPKLIIADEPVSALDVSIQAQIINLLIDLKESLGLAMLFISHDLRVVRYVSDRVAVMYLGSLVELSPTDELYDRPLHPYTSVLMEAAPSMDESARLSTDAVVLGELPSPINVPSGCRFHPRCPFADELCSKECPELREVMPGRMVACHHPLSPGQSASEAMAAMEKTAAAKGTSAS